LEAHEKSRKHTDSIEALVKERSKQSDVVAFLEVRLRSLYSHSFSQREQEAGGIPEGEGAKLDAQILAFRLRVLETVLKAGHSITAVDHYRELFESGGFALTDSSHMRQYVPLLRKHCLLKDQSFVKDKLVSLIFDGTSHFGELLLVIARCWSGTSFEQRLIRLRHSDVPLDASILGSVLLRALNTLQIDGASVVAFIKDGASVNLKAVEDLKAVADHHLGKALNVTCWSHIFNRVGKRLKLEIAFSFIKTWSSLFAKSMKVILSPLSF
jgi:hypothetical protein